MCVSLGIYFLPLPQLAVASHSLLCHRWIDILFNSFYFWVIFFAWTLLTSVFRIQCSSQALSSTGTTCWNYVCLSPKQCFFVQCLGVWRVLHWKSWFRIPFPFYSLSAVSHGAFRRRPTIVSANFMSLSTHVSCGPWSNGVGLPCSPELPRCFSSAAIASLYLSFHPLSCVSR